MQPSWQDWARRLQAISRNGLDSNASHFDQDRYQAINSVGVEIQDVARAFEMAVAPGLFSGPIDNPSSRVDVRGVVFRDETVLFVKERVDGLWTLPGGWAEVGKSPAENVVREIWEESGFKTKAVRLLAVYDRSRHGHVPEHPRHVCKMFFLCALVGGTATVSSETDGVAFFGEHELPDLSLGRVTEQQIRRMFEHHRHPEWSTDFD